MSVRITDLPEATELNGSELMPIVQNGVTRRTTLDFVNQAAPAALILQQTQRVLADTQQVLADTQQVKADTAQVLVNTEGVYNQTVMVQGQVEISIADWETQYLGAKSDPPTTDNEGNPLHNGALYWDTSLNAMFVWSGTSWTAFSSAVASVNGQIGEVVLDYTTPAEAAAAAPVQSVAGKVGAVSLTKADVGLANVDNTSDVDKPISTATQNALNLKLNSNDPSVTNAREWTAQTVSQVEAEAGTATTRRAWTAERVFQAIAAWWNASAFKTKLDGIQEGAQVNTVNSVAGKVGAVVVSKSDVGLGNVTNDAQLKIASNLSDLNNAATARTNLGLGTAATATVTTSATDTTEGRLLKVGDFGLGALFTTDTSAASVAGSGLYRATSGQPSAANAHLLHISRVASAQGAQMAIEDLSSSDVPRAYVRHRGSDGVWAGWHELYHKGNILGVVSQAGGVPTGAVVERGSNANGEYVRFADGTQICTVTLTASALPTTSITTANSQGGGYRTGQNTVVFPATFINNSICTPSSYLNHPSGWWVSAHSNEGANWQVVLKAINSVSAPTDLGEIYITLLAIGRWF